MNNPLNDQNISFFKRIVELYGESENEIEFVCIQTVDNLLQALFKSNPSVLEHSFRVASMTKKVVEHISDDPVEKKTVILSSLLHDIGIIGINQALFQKKEKWDNGELKEYYKHTILGKQVICPITFLSKCIPFIEKHHEYLDGSGFPKALKEEEIPIDVRILTLVNDIDEMAEFSPWFEKYTIKKIIEHVKKNRSVIYDERAVDAWLRVINI